MLGVHVVDGASQPVLVLFLNLIYKWAHGMASGSAGLC